MPAFLDFVRMSPAQLAQADILEMNAACASGLPGAEAFDYASHNTICNRLAQEVKAKTRAAYTVFERNPAEFDNSKAVFRALMLVTVLQRDHGIMYHPPLVNDPFFYRDARNVFAHGALMGRGTCPSLPIVFLAVGRRLGYPLKLVAAKEHLFARWDDERDRFNIECTSRGFVSHPDEHYLRWPAHTNPNEAKACGWLKSKTPREQLACNLLARAYCCLENLRYADAAEAFAYASEVDPANMLNARSLEATLNRWDKALYWPRYEPLPEIELPPLTDHPFPNVPLHLVERMDYLKRLDEALAAMEAERQAEEIREQQRRQQPEFDYEYRYTWPPENR